MSTEETREDKMDVDEKEGVEAIVESVDTTRPVKLGQPSASEDNANPYPKMALCQDIHKLVVGAIPDGMTSDELATKILREIATDLENPALFDFVTTKAHASVTAAAADSIWSPSDRTAKVAENAKHQEELNAKVVEAKEQAGDMEILDARVELSRFAAKSLTEADALAANAELLELPKISSGKKIDALMESSRVSSFYGDHKKAADFVEKAQKIATEGGGGDWDRRNRLKVYRGLQRMIERNITESAALLLDCIATFSCNEICTYQEFIVYAIMTNLLKLSRPLLKEKILDGPEVLSVARDIPIVMKLVNALYDCDYKTYLHAMVEVKPILMGDRYFYPHLNFWMRELHILAYKQFLDSYQSVTLQAMADAFGVSVDFIDEYASKFIAAGRLSAKIDKYGGVILTNRPDLKNAQYREMIQKGDLLLNRIQKLARVVDL